MASETTAMATNTLCSPMASPTRPYRAGADGTGAEIDGEIQPVTARAFGTVEQVSHPIEQDRGRAIQKESEAKQQGQQPHLVHRQEGEETHPREHLGEHDHGRCAQFIGQDATSQLADGPTGKDHGEHEASRNFRDAFGHE